MVYIDAHTHFENGIPPEGIEKCIQMMDKIGMYAINCSPMLYFDILLIGPTMKQNRSMADAMIVMA